MRVKAIVLALAASILWWGCAVNRGLSQGTPAWPQSPGAPGIECAECHESQAASWARTKHADPARMARVSDRSLHGCAACHRDGADHALAPESVIPRRPTAMSKTDQNSLCGRCHYDRAVFGLRAIDPHDRHGLFASAGLEGRKRQLSCLDCHSGHRGKGDMLVRRNVHLCYKCHKVAIATMGIFQPLNYAMAGKFCQTCHTVHGGSAAERWGRMGAGFCAVCHFTGVALAG